MKAQGNARPWIDKAEQDRAAAGLMARARRPRLHELACFHAQQCAEKYVKALLVRNRIAFPRTHDLNVLVGLAGAQGARLLPLRKALTRLNRYAVAFRYPGSRASREQMRRVLRDMKQVRQAIRRFLELPRS